MVSKIVGIGRDREIAREGREGGRHSSVQGEVDCAGSAALATQSLVAETVKRHRMTRLLRRRSRSGAGGNLQSNHGVGTCYLRDKFLKASLDCTRAG